MKSWNGLVFTFVRMAILEDDKDIRGADAESTLESGGVKNAVESAGGCGSESDADTLQLQNAQKRGLERKSDAGRELQVEERKASDERVIYDYETGQDRGRTGGVNGETLQTDFSGTGRKSEAAGVADFAAGGGQIECSAGDWEYDVGSFEIGRLHGARGQAQGAESGNESGA